MDTHRQWLIVLDCHVFVLQVREQQHLERTKTIRSKVEVSVI